MELRMNFNTFIKLKNASKISDLSGEIIEYNLNERELEGIFLVQGSYLKDDLNELTSFKEEIPFNIVLMEKEIDINDVDCVDLDYGLVEGRGVDVSFELLVEYSELEEEDTRDVIKTEVEEDATIFDVNENTEEIKEEITKEIERKLFESLAYKEDNLPSETLVSKISEPKRSIKIVYYESDKDLEDICKKNNVSISEVFKNNENNDIDKYQRVIIK